MVPQIPICVYGIFLSVNLHLRHKVVLEARLQSPAVICKTHLYQDITVLIEVRISNLLK